tara:strand:+ start:230 stop:706 length:477 start_codon:yes stop_codon:yes gene_type:complete
MNQIKDKWVLWYHSINDTNWGKNSYQKIYMINDLYDYQFIQDIFRQDHYQNGMFFCMKEGIFPNWEDPDNRSGGCLSFKVTSNKVISEWNTLLLKCIINEILYENNEEVNGISISPKKEFNIIKIWFKDDNFEYKNFFRNDKESPISLENSLYKKHDV